MTSAPVANFKTLMGAIFAPALYPGLTQVQGEALHFVRRYYAREGVPPTVRECMEALGVASSGDMQRVLRIVEHRGYLIGKGKRGYVPVRAAGMPCLACGCEVRHG